MAQFRLLFSLLSLTGDCGTGKIECAGNNALPPATLFEITLDGYGGLAFHDVSLVDGSGIDPTVAAFAGAALPVKMPSKGSEKSIGVPRRRPHCGCKNPCKCNPCHSNGFAIDPNTVTLFASIAPPVLMMPSEGSENNIEVSSCCGCPHPCKCDPCHCEGFAIDPNTVTLVASVASPVIVPSEGSEKSIEAEREGIHPKLVMTLDECQPCQCWAIMDILQPEK